jgi:uncharacterized protein (TIGR00251 family)
MLRITTEENAVLLPVKVVAGASRTRYLGELDGRAKVAVASPPEKGKANKTLTAYMARLLGVRSSDVKVASGQTSPLKTLRIEGVTSAAVLAALQHPRS